MKHSIFFIVLGASILCVSCGSSPQKAPSEGPGEHEQQDRDALNLVDLSEPEVFGLSDPDCEEDEARSLGALDSMPVWSWNGDRVVEVGYDFGDTSGVGLRNSAVREAFAGLHQVMDYECNEGCEATPYRKGTLVAPKIVSICRRDASYTRDSVEAVALSMLHGVSIANKFYKKLDGSYRKLDGSQKQKEIPRISLNILPRYEKIFHRVSRPGTGTGTGNLSQTLTDNAYWKLVSDSDQQFQVLEVLPHSQKSPTLALNDENVRYWEVPMVLGHEYGHHVFYAHAPQLMSAGGGGLAYTHESEDKGGLVGLFENEMSFTSNDLVEVNERSQTGSQSKHKPQPDISLLLMPVLEGFADLFGYYAQDHVKFPFHNIRCLGVNRDVRSKNFGNNEPKKLTTNMLTKYLASDGRQANRDCNVPSARSFYTLAAVLAYGADRLMSDPVSVLSDVGDERRRKGGLLIQWIENLDSTFKVESGHSIALYQHRALAQLLKLTTKSGKIESWQCRVLDDSFPFFRDSNYTSYLDSRSADARTKMMDSFDFASCSD